MCIYALDTIINNLRIAIARVPGRGEGEREKVRIKRGEEDRGTEREKREKAHMKVEERTDEKEKRVRKGERPIKGIAEGKKGKKKDEKKGGG